ncbi:hypothetical protein CP968_01545 [Streptomyces subrutilus]|uniref:Uncharacterized protein n=1 Tax=Streptomyces subrutilus TaxID=36818 RepID=A0A5P2UFE2_9ACTN|nr:hypothetical protein CP968_01545 [Streptomyces subrutilus]
MAHGQTEYQALTTSGRQCVTARGECGRLLRPDRHACGGHGDAVGGREQLGRPDEVTTGMSAGTAADQSVP